MDISLACDRCLTVHHKGPISAKMIGDCCEACGHEVLDQDLFDAHRRILRAMRWTAARLWLLNTIFFWLPRVESVRTVTLHHGYVHVETRVMPE